VEQRLPADPTGLGETPRGHRLADAEPGDESARRPLLDGWVVADGAAAVLCGHLRYGTAETFEHGRAHTDVANFILDDTHSRTEDGRRRAKPRQIGSDQRRRNDRVPLVFAKRAPTSDEPGQDLRRQ
jgi:hypothetical protein